MVFPSLLLAAALGVLAPGTHRILAVGAGPVALCAAKLAAQRGFQTTACVPSDDATIASKLIDAHDARSDVEILAIDGDAVDTDAIERATAQAAGLIIAFDDERAITAPALDIFCSSASAPNLKHVTMMSRYLNGKGMGFWANSAKIAANNDVWCAGADAVKRYRESEALVRERARELNIDYTIVRAGTLKGGASGTRSYEYGEEDGGEASFLNPFFYTLGQQDVVNWRLLIDCDSLGVRLEKGDTLPGPGLTAILTATTPVGAGDSHRGAVATALVESLRVDVAANADFSVAAVKGRDFPAPEAFQALMREALA